MAALGLRAALLVLLVITLGCVHASASAVSGTGAEIPPSRFAVVSQDVQILLARAGAPTANCFDSSAASIVADALNSALEEAIRSASQEELSYSRTLSNVTLLLTNGCLPASIRIGAASIRAAVQLAFLSATGSAYRLSLSAHIAVPLTGTIPSDAAQLSGSDAVNGTTLLFHLALAAPALLAGFPQQMPLRWQGWLSSEYVGSTSLFDLALGVQAIPLLVSDVDLFDQIDPLVLCVVTPYTASAAQHSSLTTLQKLLTATADVNSGMNARASTPTSVQCSVRGAFAVLGMPSLESAIRAGTIGGIDASGSGIIVAWGSVWNAFAGMDRSRADYSPSLFVAVRFDSSSLTASTDSPAAQAIASPRKVDDQQAAFHRLYSVTARQSASDCVPLNGSFVFPASLSSAFSAALIADEVYAVSISTRATASSVGACASVNQAASDAENAPSGVMSATLAVERPTIASIPVAVVNTDARAMSSITHAHALQPSGRLLCYFAAESGELLTCDTSDLYSGGGVPMADMALSQLEEATLQRAVADIFANISSSILANFSSGADAMPLTTARVLSDFSSERARALIAACANTSSIAISGAEQSVRGLLGCLADATAAWSIQRIESRLVNGTLDAVVAHSSVTYFASADIIGAQHAGDAIAQEITQRFRAADSNFVWSDLVRARVAESLRISARTEIELRMPLTEEVMNHHRAILGKKKPKKTQVSSKTLSEKSEKKLDVNASSKSEEANKSTPSSFHTASVTDWLADRTQIRVVHFGEISWKEMKEQTWVQPGESSIFELSKPMKSAEADVWIVDVKLKNSPSLSTLIDATSPPDDESESKSDDDVKRQTWKPVLVVKRPERNFPRIVSLSVSENAFNVPEGQWTTVFGMSHRGYLPKLYDQMVTSMNTRYDVVGVWSAQSFRLVVDLNDMTASASAAAAAEAVVTIEFRPQFTCPFKQNLQLFFESDNTPVALRQLVAYCAPCADGTMPDSGPSASGSGSLASGCVPCGEGQWSIDGAPGAACDQLPITDSPALNPFPFCECEDPAVTVLSPDELAGSPSASSDSGPGAQSVHASLLRAPSQSRFAAAAYVKSDVKTNKYALSFSSWKLDHMEEIVNKEKGNVAYLANEAEGGARVIKLCGMNQGGAIRFGALVSGPAGSARPEATSAELKLRLTTAVETGADGIFARWKLLDDKKYFSSALKTTSNEHLTRVYIDVLVESIVSIMNENVMITKKITALIEANIPFFYQPLAGYPKAGVPLYLFDDPAVTKVLKTTHGDNPVAKQDDVAELLKTNNRFADTPYYARGPIDYVLALVGDRGGGIAQYPFMPVEVKYKLQDVSLDGKDSADNFQPFVQLRMQLMAMYTDMLSSKFSIRPTLQYQTKKRFCGILTDYKTAYIYCLDQRDSTQKARFSYRKFTFYDASAPTAPPNKKAIQDFLEDVVDYITFLLYQDAHNLSKNRKPKCVQYADKYL